MSLQPIIAIHFIILATILARASCLFFSTTTGTTTLTGFEVDVDIGATTTTVTARVALSQAQVWHGIGFGQITMRNTYAIIQEFNIASPTVPNYSIRRLGRHAGGNPNPQGTETDATASLWTKSFESGDPVIITLTRANNVANGEHIFDPVATTLNMIHAYGADTNSFTTSSGMGDRVGEQYNFIATTTTPTTATPTTSIPTTTMPTTSIPTTSTPTTNTPTTIMPTTMTPTTSTPTTSIPTVYLDPNATTLEPTTSQPTVFQSTIVYTTGQPTTSQPTTAIPTTSIPTTIMPSTSIPTTIMPSTSIPTTSEPTTQTSVPTTSTPTAPTALPTTSYPTTMSPSTISPTTTSPTASTTASINNNIISTTEQPKDEIPVKKYPSGVGGMVEKGQDWIIHDATQSQLIIVIVVFASVLICCLCCWYFTQSMKTRKRRKQYFPNEAKKKKGKNYEDLADIDPANPDSSIRNNNAHIIAAAPSDEQILNVEIQPQITDYDEHKLEESISVDINIAAAPPPPSEPVPQDILHEHRERTNTQMKQRKDELEMGNLNRVHSQSNISERSITISDEKGNADVAAVAVPLANKRNNEDPALALLSSDDAIISSSNNNNKNNKQQIGIEAEFGALSIEMNDMKNQDDADILTEVNKTQMGKVEHQSEDPALSLLSSDANINTQQKQTFSSIEAEFNALSTEIDRTSTNNVDKKSEAIRDENDPFASLDMDVNPIKNQHKSESNKNVTEQKLEATQDENDPFASLDMDINPIKDENLDHDQSQQENKQHKNDPFASLDMGNMFDNKTEQKDRQPQMDKKDKDAGAMDVLGGLLSANPEFGNNDNIFGGTGDNAADAILNSGVSSNIIDLKKYASVEDTVPIDYDKLTKISDTDQYKVVSVQETVTVDDGDGNVHHTVDKKMNESDKTQELENILQDNMVHASENNVKIIAEVNVNEEKKQQSDPFDELAVSSPLDNMLLVSSDDKYNNMVPATEMRQTVDMDNLIMSGNMNNDNNINVGIQVETPVIESKEQDEEEEESMGSVIINDTPRVSEVVHEKLNPQIFGNDDDSSSDSSESEQESNGTDPNGY